MLEYIYVVRHGFRSNWIVNPESGEYSANIPSPTGIASDPALASYGVGQSEALAEKVVSFDPPVDVVISSPFYRCLQTVKPAIAKLSAKRQGSVNIKVENGFGEFYGRARFDHPSPASLDVLHEHFPHMLDLHYEAVIVPSTNGETIDGLHNRVAYALHRVIAAIDNDPSGPKTLLICTHAATMIAIGRALTGSMPEDPAEDDFLCYTCSVSKFVRRRKGDGKDDSVSVDDWNREFPDDIPIVGWRGGKGVLGGWDCKLNGDTSHLENGAERGWQFSGDEAFMADPNAYNDRLNTIETVDTEIETERKGSRL